MGGFFFKLGCAALVASELLIPSLGATQTQPKEKKKEKSIHQDVLNFDGGIFFETDGSVSEITCFRLQGRVTSDHFFDNFKRIDDEFGTQYRRGQEVLTEFPERLDFSFVMIDFPCPSELGRSGPRRYLTKEIMRTLRFSFYWKRGLELRHIDDIKQEYGGAERIVPYNTQRKEELPERYRWDLKFSIPSAGVPLTDRVVLIIRTADGHTAARVAARL